MTTDHADSTVASTFKVSVPELWSKDRLRSLVIWTRIQADVIAEGDRLVLWAPLFLLLGTWGYFKLWFEPPVILVGLMGIAAAGLVWLGRNQRALLVIGLLLSGFVFAKIRQEYVATPLLQSAISQSDVTGIVADVQGKDRGRVLMLVEIQSATNIPEGQMPRRLQVSAFPNDKVFIGDTISFSANLHPLPRPLSPGGFDYGRMLYFWSVGGTARVKGEVFQTDAPVAWRYQLRRQFQILRGVMSARITAAIPGPLGAFADAMITGERSAIPVQMNASLQVSGLYHILSISGLHMSMVAGGVFWAVRALLALVPFLALHYPIKKWAAVAALIAGLIYMLLADFGAATERSYIMIAVMFFAVLVDRPAISLRNLALSAILILIVTPEESTGASFQMSFLAVMALVAFFEWWKSREVTVPVYNAARAFRLGRTLWRGVVISSLTTLVAGGASSLAAVYHFGRASPYGVIANGIAVPIIEIFVMPEALVAALLMPFGLEKWTLKIMEFGLWLTMHVSDFVASLPGANMMIAQPSLIGTLLMTLGLYVLCMAKKAVKYVGFAAMVLGVLFAGHGERASILVEERATNVALLNAQGEMVLANDKGGKFSVTKWLTTNGETTLMQDAASREGWTCVADSCFAEMGGLQVGYLRKQDGLTECPPVDIIIADFPLRGVCSGVKMRVDRFDVWRNGAYALYVNNGSISFKTARGEQGDRPWVFTPKKGIKVAVVAENATP